MESAERLQRRIGTLGELHGIVRTMKALSATSIRQYEQAVQALDDYHRSVDLGLRVVLQDIEPSPPEAVRRGRPPRLAAVVFGSDHGLCGRFKEDIVAHALPRMAASAASPEGHRLLVVGSRAADGLEQAGQTVEDVLPLPGSSAGITATVQRVLLKIDAWRGEGDIRYVYLFYNHHQRSGGHRPTGIELLPVNLERFRRLHAGPWPSRRIPRYSLDRRRLLQSLLRQYFFVSVARACAESQASEHSNRLRTMQAAEKNLAERREAVTAQFRRIRQAAITTELLDVITGFEAVTGTGRD